MKYIIIGSGAAGISAAQTIEKIDKDGQITIVTGENHPPYYLAMTPMVIDGEYTPEEIYRDKKELPARAVIKTGARVKKITPDENSILMDDDSKLSYDRLLITTGSSARSLQIPGVDGSGIFTLRCLDDAIAIKEAAKGVKSVVVIGGGRIGCKAAIALKKLGLEVTVIEKLDRIIPAQLDDESSVIIGDALKSFNIGVITGHGITQVIRENNEVVGVILENGQTVNASMVVIAVGVIPNTDLARQAGVRVDEGIIVDDGMRTNLPAIYAAGDVAEISDVVSGEKIVSGIWTNAVDMGETAGANMAGSKRTSRGAFSTMNAMDLAGKAVVSVGLINPPINNGHEIIIDRSCNSYRKFVIGNDILKGVILVDNLDNAGIYTTLIREKTNLGEVKDMLTSPGFGYAPYVKVQSPLVNNYIFSE